MSARFDALQVAVGNQEYWQQTKGPSTIMVTDVNIC